MDLRLLKPEDFEIQWRVFDYGNYKGCNIECTLPNGERVSGACRYRINELPKGMTQEELDRQMVVKAMAYVLKKLRGYNYEPPF